MCARALPQGPQGQVRSSRLVELRSQPVAKREQNLAKCWSEWQDLNLRPPGPERGALPKHLSAIGQYDAEVSGSGRAGRRDRRGSRGLTEYPPGRERAYAIGLRRHMGSSGISICIAGSAITGSGRSGRSMSTKGIISPGPLIAPV